MPAYSYQVYNGKLVRQGLENFVGKVPLVGRKQLYDVGKRILKRVDYTKTNPTPRGKYVRTFTLKGSRRLEPLEGGYRLSIDPVNPRGRRYGAFPLGTMEPNSQAWFHKGRWKPFRDITLEELATLRPEVLAALGVVLAEETAKANRK